MSVDKSVGEWEETGPMKEKSEKRKVKREKYKRKQPKQYSNEQRVVREGIRR